MQQQINSEKGLSWKFLNRILPGLSDSEVQNGKSVKRQPAVEIFKQVFYFLLDGTSRHLVYFDSLKEAPGSACSLAARDGWHVCLMGVV